MPDADKPFRQHMEEESSQELGRSERHYLLYTTVRIVPPTEADLFSVEGKQTMIGNGNTMRVAAEIAQHLQRAAERRFGINHPELQMQSPEQLRKLFRIGKQGGGSAAAQCTAFPQPLQSSDKFAAEHFSKHWNR